MIITPEINSPAGNFEKLKFAVKYGADAVYLSGKSFGLRKHAGNFTEDELRQASIFCHSRNVKFYVTINIFARNSDFEELGAYLELLSDIGVDAVIVSDPGVFMFVRDYSPHIPIFISTQANTMNLYAAEFWKKHGASRIILAREININEISEIKKKVDISLEVFIHGAVCISYSGRCFLSKNMIGRDANEGECAHPCRWKYYLMEETRKGEYFPVEFFEDGAYIFNSKDLNCLELIGEFIDAGVDCFKIEGRMKSVYYTAATTAVYKNAVKIYSENPDKYHEKLCFFKQELLKISNRKYHTGFYAGKIPGETEHNSIDSGYYREFDFVGIVIKHIAAQLCEIETRAKFFLNDQLEVLNPGLNIVNIEITELVDSLGNSVDFVNPNQIVKIRYKSRGDLILNSLDILRKKNR